MRRSDPENLEHARHRGRMSEVARHSTITAGPRNSSSGSQAPAPCPASDTPRSAQDEQGAADQPIAVPRPLAFPPASVKPIAILGLPELAEPRQEELTPPEDK